MKNSINHFLLHLGSFGALVALGSGCASPAKPEAMTPVQFDVVRKHPHSTSVTVTGGKETNPLWKSDISSEAFAQAVTDAINGSGVFSSVINQGGSDYRLDITLVEVMSPNVGFNLTSTVVTEWRLTEAFSDEALSVEFIATPFTATVGDAFVAVTRLRKANEGSARENIREGVRRLSELQLPVKPNGN